MRPNRRLPHLRPCNILLNQDHPRQNEVKEAECKTSQAFRQDGPDLQVTGKDVQKGVNSQQYTLLFDFGPVEEVDGCCLSGVCRISNVHRPSQCWFVHMRIFLARVRFYEKAWTHPICTKPMHPVRAVPAPILYARSMTRARQRPGGRCNILRHKVPGRRICGPGTTNS